MINGIRIYVEGGGDGKETRSWVRQGFRQFLEDLVVLARERRIRWNIIACGPRNAAYDGFTIALENHPSVFNVLLVDSEAPVTQKPWQHLQNRDGWNSDDLDDECCHLVVQTMESWLKLSQFLILQ